MGKGSAVTVFLTMMAEQYLVVDSERYTVHCTIFRNSLRHTVRKTFVLKINVTHTCQVNKEVALKMYREMVTLQIMDNIFYEAQRQGRISFYLTSNGEEAINIASAAALSIDDIVLPQVQHQSLRHSIA